MTENTNPREGKGGLTLLDETVKASTATTWTWVAEVSWMTWPR